MRCRNVLLLLLLSFQPEHLEFSVAVRLVRVKFLGFHIPLKGTVKLQGAAVLLYIGQAAGNGGALAVKFRLLVPQNIAVCVKAMGHTLNTRQAASP